MIYGPGTLSGTFNKYVRVELWQFYRNSWHRVGHAASGWTNEYAPTFDRYREMRGRQPVLPVVHWGPWLESLQRFSRRQRLRNHQAPLLICGIVSPVQWKTDSKGSKRSNSGMRTHPGRRQPGCQP